MNNNRFSSRKRSLSEEDEIRRRAIIFGILTILLAAAIIFWGVPLFIKLVGFLGDLKSEKEGVAEEDVIPPPVPRLPYIPEATNSAILSVSGFTEPKAKVTVNFNQEAIGTEADEDGNFSLKKLTLSKGTNTLSFWATDEAGNQSEETDAFEIIYDTQPPDLEIQSPENNQAVEEQTIEVKGRTETDARVLVNDHVVIVGKEGEFSTKVTLKEGGNEIVVLAQDKAGNQEEKKINVTYLP